MSELKPKTTVVSPSKASHLGDVLVYTEKDCLKLIADAGSSVKRDLLDDIEKEYPEMRWVSYSTKWQAFRKKHLGEK